MKIIQNTLIVIVLALFISCNNDVDKNNRKEKITVTEEIKERIISLDGTITEILVNLGKEENIVATDVTSMYPERLSKSVVQLGHTKSINIESILAQKPTKIFATEKGTPDNLKSQIKEAKLDVVYYKAEKSLEGAKKLIKNISSDLNKDKKGEEMTLQIEEDIKGLQNIENKPKVMFIYARGAGTLLVAGKDTPVYNMINLSGGLNSVTEYSEYKPLTTEAVINANPDVILMFNSGLKSLGGIEGLSKIPALAQTEAIKNKQVITMNGLFLTGFGPRTGKAIKELNKKLAEYAK